MFAITKLLHRGDGVSQPWHLRLVAVLGVLLAAGGGVVGWLALRPAAAATAPAPALTELDPGAPAAALVFVSGAVAHPGLYRLSAGARIADAIAAAGGITPDADPGRLPDLASRVHDGHQVNVPFGKSGTRTSTAGKLDVNSATLDELRAVPGMPLGLPEAIVDYRTQFGPFRSLTDMRMLLGLDGPTLTGLRPYLRVVPVAP
jgi:competence protein ComEA